MAAEAMGGSLDDTSFIKVGRNLPWRLYMVRLSRLGCDLPS